jgi:hypothetical protein
MVANDPVVTALEIRAQLASEKRKLGFFFGAGTSMAVGLPGIVKLTEMIQEQLQEPARSQFMAIKSELSKDSNVENVLDRVRIYKELIGESEKKKFCGLNRLDARNLDSQICQAIYDIVGKDPPGDITPHIVFAKWLRALHSCRDWPVEIFTTNYDTLLERTMEDSGLPFFDGFIGSISPFFMPESVEMQEVQRDSSLCTPRTWTRLWKMHGSINWFMHKAPQGGGERITRLSGTGIRPGAELVIFPSREKYAQSRKLPFIAFQDRFRKFLSLGECHVAVVGYSFSDEHLNDIIFQSLRSNPRLAITAFIYGNLFDHIIQYAKEYRNLTLYGADKMCIGGITKSWSEPTREPKNSESFPFWDEKKKRFILGDFVAFASFLEMFIGFKQGLEGLSEGSSHKTEKELSSQEGISHEK